MNTPTLRLCISTNKTAKACDPDHSPFTQDKKEKRRRKKENEEQEEKGDQEISN